MQPRLKGISVMSPSLPRFVLAQCATVLLIVLQYALFLPSALNAWLIHSTLAMIIVSVLPLLIPTMCRPRGGRFSPFFNGTLPIVIALTSSTLRIQGHELHIEYVLPMQMAMNFWRVAVDRRLSRHP